MIKLQQTQMKAVEEIANSMTVKQMLETLDEWMPELPDELERAKSLFYLLKSEFELGVNSIINKYIDDQ